MMRNHCIFAALCSLLFVLGESNIVEVNGRQHPDAHIDGFRIKSVVTYKGRALHRRKLLFDDNPHLAHPDHMKFENERRAARRLDALPEFSAEVNSRARVLTLAKLNCLAYPDPTGELTELWSDEEMATVMKNGDMRYNSTDNMGDKIGHKRIQDAIRQEVDDTKSEDESAEMSFIFTPEKTAELETGIALIEFVRGDLRVLVFRGTMTPGDYTNMNFFMADFIMEKMTGAMKNSWINNAKLPWGPEQKERAEIGDAQSRAALRAGFNYLPAKNAAKPEYLVDSVKAAQAEPNQDDSLGILDDVELDLATVQATGYWTLTKALAEHIHEELGEDEELLVSGHSQGGTRAQLFSMYLDKKYAVKYPVVSYAATGAACSVRKMWGGANLLADVDPTVQRDDFMDYTHPLDPWGEMLGVDMGYNCFYGVKDIKNTRAYKYCSKIWGFPGPTLIAAISGLYFPGGATEEQRRNFDACRYFTHTSGGMYEQLSQPGEILEDGTPAESPCVLQDIIPLDDPDGICPVGGVKSDEAALGLTLLALVLIIVGGVLVGGVCAVIAFIKCCKKKKGGVKPAEETQSPGYQ